MLSSAWRGWSMPCASTVLTAEDYYQVKQAGIESKVWSDFENFRTWLAFMAIHPGFRREVTEHLHEALAQVNL